MDDAVHNHSAHGYYITRIEGGKICMILLHVILHFWSLHQNSMKIDSGLSLMLMSPRHVKNYPMGRGGQGKDTYT